MQAEKLMEILGADFYTGVPDSQLKALCNCLMNTYGIDPQHHIIAANEGNCAALAAGYHLATGKVPVVYMQNSGEGNIINPAASLLNDKVYAIPMIFVIGWRGEPGIHDEPQHIYQGEVTLKLLEDMGIASFVIGKETTDAQLAEAMQRFRPLLEKGLDVVHITLSSGISGVINSANLAKEHMEAKFPERKIYVVDSLGASSGYGLLMDKLADLRDEGMSAADLAAWATEHRLELHHWFFSTDLTFYIKGGRVTKTAGFFGQLLGICPLLNMDDAGRLIPREKVRSKRKVIKRIVEMMEAHAQGGLDYDGKCYISMSACMEDAKAVAELVEQTFPKLNGKVLINNIGTTIGSHTGPGTVALFFWGDKRTK